MTNDSIIYCTYFDKGYLLKGLSLHSSFVRHHPSASLWILCFDAYTYTVLSRLRLKNVTLIPLSQFEDSPLLVAKKNRSLVEYYWTCTPSLPLYLFRLNPKVQHVCYLDADLYFFSNLIPVWQEFNGSSIYTVEHRFPPGQENRMYTSGRFNVGFQIFRRDRQGLACLRRWRQQCLDWCYWRLEDGKLGDQLYLSEWPRLYSRLVISQNLGVTTAPWNIGQYSISLQNDKPYIGNDELIFYHFHQLKISRPLKFDFASGYYLSRDVKKYIYTPYIRELKLHYNRVKKIDPTFSVPPSHTGFIKIPQWVASWAGPLFWKITFRITRRRPTFTLEF